MTLDSLRRELHYLQDQLREAQSRASVLIGKRIRVDRVHRELADLRAEIAAVEHRIAQNRAE
jgi:hypothetical protein